MTGPEKTKRSGGSVPLPVHAVHRLRLPPSCSGRGRGRAERLPLARAAPGTRAPGPGLTPPVKKGARGRSRAALGLLSAFASGSSPSAVRATRGIAGGRRQLPAGEEIASPSFGFSLARVSVEALNAGPDGDGNSLPAWRADYSFFLLNCHSDEHHYQDSLNLTMDCY
ncbi:uncharacterized protein ACIQIH_010363 [Cyanocitta cristata]